MNMRSTPLHLAWLGACCLTVLVSTSSPSSQTPTIFAAASKHHAVFYKVEIPDVDSSIYQNQHHHQHTIKRRRVVHDHDPSENNTESLSAREQRRRRVKRNSKKASSPSSTSSFDSFLDLPEEEEQDEDVEDVEDRTALDEGEDEEETDVIEDMQITLDEVNQHGQVNMLDVLEGDNSEYDDIFGRQDGGGFSMTLEVSKQIFSSLMSDVIHFQSERFSLIVSSSFGMPSTADTTTHAQSNSRANLSTNQFAAFRVASLNSFQHT